MVAADPVKLMVPPTAATSPIGPPARATASLALPSQ